MRPLELVIEGFRSFGERAVFDWRGRGLVGIVGPIGSGKSSILDAIVFALYGKTPVFESGTKALIKQDCETARVELAFEVEGRAWRAVRVIRRRGASQHALYRGTQYRGTQIAAAEGGPIAVPECEKEREVSARIGELLGLDFQAFCRSVLLAQNRFAEFLNASPGMRDKVLKGVFGFDRIDAMHDIARRRRAAAELTVKELEGRLAVLEEDRRRVDAARQAADRSAEDAERLEQAEEQIRQLDGLEDASQRERQQATERLEAMQAVGELLPESGEVEALLGAAEAAAAAVAVAQKAWRRARLTVSGAEKALLDTEAEVGSLESLVRAESRCEALAAARETTDEERKNLRGVEAWVTTANAALAKAVVQREAAELATRESGDKASLAAQEAERAEEELHQVQQREMARALRVTLEPGKPCPVCERPVDQMPEEMASPALDRARQEVEKLRREKEEGDALHREASDRQARRRQQASTAEGARDDAEAQRSRAEKRLARALEKQVDLEGELGKLSLQGGAGDPLEAIGRLRARLSTASAHVESSRAQERQAAGDADEARRGLEVARRDEAALVNRLSSLAGRVGWDGVEPSNEENEAEGDLGAYGLLAGIEQRLREVRTAAQAERDAAAARQRAASEERLALLETLGFEKSQSLEKRSLAATRFERPSLETDLKTASSFDSHLASARSARDRDAARLTEIERRLKKADELDEQLKDAAKQLDLYKQLSGDLTAPHFLRYLLDEERGSLAELGSERFEMLSGGRYRFTTDATFSVVDLANAESVRKADTLSGGETFLASLALALALAEKVVGGGGRLDAFFLDEGFGSLDQEHLDLALAGIERLVTDSPGRLVVVVSHVSEMHERVEDLIELDRAPAGGETVVLRGASGSVDAD